MASMTTRFHAWRGADGIKNEQRYLNTALDVERYIKSVKSLSDIKTGVSTTSGAQFKAFDQHSGRSLGVAAYLKLVTDELLENLPADNVTHEALSKLNRFFTSFYEKPAQISTPQAQEFIENINALLAMDDAVFADKKRAKKIFYSLYMLLQMMDPTLKDLAFGLLPLIKLVVNINAKRKEVAGIILKIEAKVASLESKMDEPEESDVLGAIQAHFNPRYLALVNEAPAEHVPSERESDESAVRSLDISSKLTRLEEEMTLISDDIARLLKLKTEKADLEAQIVEISALLNAAETNDSLVSGRKYFLDFIKVHKKPYQVLLTHLNPDVRDSFLKKVRELPTSILDYSMTDVATTALSWVLHPLTTLVRTYVHQGLQNLAAEFMPSTPDSECKTALRQISGNCLVNLRQKWINKEREMDALNNQLFNENADLKQLITEEPIVTLVNFRTRLDETKAVLQYYRNTFGVIKENMEFLNTYHANSTVLDDFLQIHDTFWVKLSNFFAQFLSIFKTKAAVLVDRVKECKHSVDLLASQYQEAVEQQMEHIDKSPELPAEVKTALKNQFQTEMTKAHEEQETPSAPANKRNVRLLMGRLSLLFAETPRPRQTTDVSLDEEHDATATTHESATTNQL